MTRRRNDPEPDIRKQHDPEINASLYVTGELPGRLVRWFEHHLLDCDDCWREVWLARRGRSVAEHAREVAPAILRDDVRGAIHLSAATDGTSRRRRGLRRFRRNRD